MDSVVFYKPLAAPGLVRLDLNSCPRYIPFAQSGPEFEGFIAFGFHQTPEGRWIEGYWVHEPLSVRQQFDPHALSFREVPPAYVALKLGGELPEAPQAPQARGSDPEEETIPVRVVNAAYALKRQGRRVSLRVACDKARVDRANFRRKYPEAVVTVKMIAAPDCQPTRGSKRDGGIEAWGDDD